MTEYALNIDFIRKAIHCGIPFAVWSFPGTQLVQKAYCNPKELIKTYSTRSMDNHKGFVFAPFHVCKHLPIYIIPFGKNVLPDLENCNSPREPHLCDVQKFSSDIEKSKTDHLRQVNTFLNVFEGTEIQKAVLSRNKWLKNYTIDQMPELFEALNKNYPNAFVYQVFIPGAGYWVGATPELLFATQNGNATTVSLAGTQPVADKTAFEWNHKELIEQELVTEHIRSVLNEFDIYDFKETGPETAIAGQMVHLKTLIEFNKHKIDTKVGQFIEKLHPTPAVCGVPVKDALELILETEGYDREYYTGYLGPFDAGKIDLYVNLRCLQAFDNGVVLYAGGGITPESDALNEWEETRLKIQTLEKILETL